MKDDAQRLGYEFEQEVATRFGADLQPGSGSRNYAKLDVKGQGFIIEAKHTLNKSFSITRELFGKVREAVSGTNGYDPTAVPIIVVRLKGQDGEQDLDVAVMPLNDLVDWVKAPPEIVPATKMDGIRAAARRSTLLDD